MYSNTGFRVLAGAAALAISGTALANTTLDATSTGDVFLNIVDATNNTSFVFDTGVSQALFNGGSSYSYSLASDPNYTAFLAAVGGTDTLDYSVLSATNKSGVTTDYFTSSVPLPATITQTNIATGQSTIGTFVIGANSITSTTTNSASLSGTFEYGTALLEGVISKQLLNNGTASANNTYADDASIGTPLAFYEDSASRSGGVTVNGQAFAGTWNLTSGGVLTYGGTSAVPLPTPLLLLLSGLGLMGVVARRGKTA
jgi:hypothetical protein